MFLRLDLSKAFLACAALTIFGVAPLAAQSLFDDFGEPAWGGSISYSRILDIEPIESETLLAQLGFSSQGRVDFAVMGGQTSSNVFDVALVGASAELFFRSSSTPLVPSLFAQVVRSSPSGSLAGPNTTVVQLGGGGTFVLDLSENVRLLPRMAFSISKAFVDPNERGEFEAIMIAHLGATLFMKLSEWKPTGVFVSPGYSLSDGDAAVAATLGFSIGL